MPTTITYVQQRLSELALKFYVTIQPEEVRSGMSCNLVFPDESQKNGMYLGYIGGMHTFLVEEKCVCYEQLPKLQLLLNEQDSFHHAIQILQQRMEKLLARDAPNWPVDDSPLRFVRMSYSLNLQSDNSLYFASQNIVYFRRYRSLRTSSFSSIEIMVRGLPNIPGDYSAPQGIMYLLGYIFENPDTMQVIL